MITQEQIGRVALELEQAEDTLSSLRLKRWTSKEAGAAYASAKGRIELVGEELERLNAQYEAEQRALADRPNVEKAAAKDINAAKKELEASRDALTTAASTAQQALLDLAGAADAHNALIARHSAALTVRGLALDEHNEHQTGGTRDGVRIRGDWWANVDPASLLTWVMARATSACLPRARVLTQTLKRFGGHGLERRGDLLLDKVAKLPEAPVTAVSRPRQRHLGAPVYIRSKYEAEENIRRDLQGYGGNVPDSVKAEVALRLRLLEEGIESGHVIARTS